MKIYYIWDAYCGWCYGFGKILKPFLNNNKDIEVEIISGGLFIGDRVKKISEFTHIKEVNKNIEQFYGVEFGENYNKLLDTGEFVVNSNDIAKAFTILKNNTPNNEHINIAYDLQKQFFEEGNSLSDIETYKKIVKKYDLNNIILEEISRELSNDNFSEDFKTAYEYGIKSYPTLILRYNDEYYELRGNALTVEQLEENLAKIINKK